VGYGRDTDTQAWARAMVDSAFDEPYLRRNRRALATPNESSHGHYG